MSLPLFSSQTQRLTLIRNGQGPDLLDCVPHLALFSRFGILRRRSERYLRGKPPSLRRILSQAHEIHFHRHSSSSSLLPLPSHPTYSTFHAYILVGFCSCFFSLLVEYLYDLASLLLPSASTHTCSPIQRRGKIPHYPPTRSRTNLAPMARLTLRFSHGRERSIHFPRSQKRNLAFVILPPISLSFHMELIDSKDGETEYVQLKPILAFVTVVLKATGTYKDGSLQADSGCSSLLCSTYFKIELIRRMRTSQIPIFRSLTIYRLVSVCMRWRCSGLLLTVIYNLYVSLTVFSSALVDLMSS